MLITEEQLNLILVVETIPRKYSDDDIKNTALKYNHKIDFMKNDRNAYAIAIKRKLIPDITGHMIPLGNLENRLVYAYEFPETKTVYIGLTGNEESRHNQHHKTDKNPQKTSPVFKYMEMTGFKPEKKNIK